MSMIKNILVSFSLLFLSIISYGQNFTIVEKEGEKYYQHKVESGHTLYAIATLYDSDEEIIRSYNEELLTGGLNVGQTIYIPVSPNIKPGEITNPIRIEDGFLIHRVLKKETLFSICRRYTVDINDVLELNHEANSGIKKGNELKIPVNDVNSVVSVAPPVNFSISKWKTHQVLIGETLYGVSKKYAVKIKSILDINDGLPEGLKAGQVINIPISLDEAKNKDESSVNDVINSWKPKMKGDNPFRAEYNVALALPLYSSRLGEDKLSSKEKRIQNVALSFYRGSFLAAQKLKEDGLAMNIHVLNITDDKEEVKLLASDEKLHQIDLFIGPFQKESLARVIEIASGSDAHVVCPTPQSGKILLSNSHVSKVTPAGSTMMGEAGKYIAHLTANPNVILVTTKWLKDKRNIQVFKREYYSNLADSTEMVKKKLSEIEVDKLTVASLKAAMSDSRENILVMPSEEKISLGTLVNVLPFISEDQNLTIYLTDKWIDNDYVDASVRNRFNVHIPSSFTNNYNSEEMIEFQELYSIEYSEVIDEYSVLGHDIMLYYGRGLIDYGLDFPFYFGEMNTDDLVDLVFNFQAVGPDSGFENHGIHMLYFEDFELKEKK
jgi:LysM repeat protein